MISSPSNQDTVSLWGTPLFGHHLPVVGNPSLLLAPRLGPRSLFNLPAHDLITMLPHIRRIRMACRLVSKIPIIKGLVSDSRTSIAMAMPRHCVQTSTFPHAITLPLGSTTTKRIWRIQPLLVRSKIVPLVSLPCPQKFRMLPVSVFDPLCISRREVPC